MKFNDLLSLETIDPKTVIVMRHRPKEPKLNRVFRWLAAERHDLFNAYQQTQGKTVEKAMLRVKYVASFVGHTPGKAVFVGLYQIGDHRPLSFDEYWSVPAYQEMKKYDIQGFTREQEAVKDYVLWFDLEPTNFYSDWRGKLVVGWPPPELSWWRYADKNVLPVLAVTERSILTESMPSWETIDLSWAELSVLPADWKAALNEWRGVYLIFDRSDRKSYVGSCYGKENMLGRWTNYASSGHGGNKLLKQRNAENFQFSILQRLSPDEKPEEVIRVEGTWKSRLHTRSPLGLNDN